MSLGKMSDFVSFPLLGVTLVITLRNLILKVIQMFFEKNMTSDLNMFYGKMSDFVSFP